ncbi:oligosaccharide flippase family protein [Waterburya agarophytonicola K14]|uniref:Oligosaccharide flippase family protein n=1 Tax=Waterburya agarophytonicola KI4 TaxID=2874699 RepID=A0A964BM64_9CYAN|nr:oligosaccharide flippase family protein [Waterburya agarophytonicola]MCC0175954.1 oligosaccharide flippase family protein [Waterburya agarophytonicola KI4]
MTIFKSFILKLGVQGVYFVILARTFEPTRYGAYVGIVAIVSIFIPFASLGAGEVLIQNVSRDRTLFREYWGTTILKTLIFGSIFTSLILIIYQFIPIPGISIWAVFLVSLANLIFLRLNDTTRDVFIAVGLISHTAKSIIMVALNRSFASVLFLLCFDDHSILTWCILYCFATFVASLMSTFLVIKQVAYPKFNLSKVGKELRLGLSFAVGISAQNIYNDLDKSMLAKLSTLEATGIYGAAYQILNVAFTPIQSVALASFRKFFQQGASGIKGSFALCKKLLPMSLAYSMIAIAGIAICSPIIPKILGSEYQDSAAALIWLSPTIVFRTMHFFAADTLTGANYQSVRTTAQVIVAIFNGLLNFWLIPLYGWHGAIWATIASEFLLMVFLWGAIYKYHNQST